MIYIKIQRKEILDLLVKNSKIISSQTVNEIYEYIKRMNQNINFNNFQDLKIKIKTTLCSLKKSFERVKRKKTRRDIENFNLKCSNEYFEFQLKPICLNHSDIRPPDDQPPLGVLLGSLCIEKHQLDKLFKNLKL